MGGRIGIKQGTFRWEPVNRYSDIIKELSINS